MAELSTLARPYAKAAFEYAAEHTALAEWSQMLALADVVAGDDKVARVLASPEPSADQLANLFVELCGDGLNGPARNFIHILAEHKRLALLPFVAEQFEALRAERERSVDVEIASAYELTAEQQQHLLDWLGNRFGREINLHTRVDDALLGGVVIRAGDTVIDNSIRGRLTKLAEALR